MKVREIMNTSSETIEVKLEDGSATVAPGCGIRNVRVDEAELNRIRSKTKVKLDLTEIKGLLD